jgi:hypothetical protein
MRTNGTGQIYFGKLSCNSAMAIMQATHLATLHRGYKQRTRYFQVVFKLSQPRCYIHDQRRDLARLWIYWVVENSHNLQVRDRVAHI